MRLLLDTHILLWFLADRPELSCSARALIGDATNQSFVSSISMWEITIKAKLGKLNVEPSRIYTATLQSHFTPITFNFEHALATVSLPEHHHDPFDRALLAQAICEPFRLLTHDHQLASYGNPVLLV
jgi:PIN domain nuclease of toxin-antitoxin system